MLCSLPCIINELVCYDLFVLRSSLSFVDLLMMPKGGSLENVKPKDESLTEASAKGNDYAA